MQINDVLGKAGNARNLKAADHIGRTLKKRIINVGTDNFARAGQPEQVKFVLYFDKANDSDSVALSPTNTRKLGDAFGPDTDTWVNREIWLSTQQYDIEGKITHGWTVIVPPEEDAGPNDDIPFG